MVKTVSKILKNLTLMRIWHIKSIVKYEINMKTKLLYLFTHSMKYYWVNQGSTWKTERTDGFLWAPLLNKEELSHWTILKELEPGDIVFSYL